MSPTEAPPGKAEAARSESDHLHSVTREVSVAFVGNLASYFFVIAHGFLMAPVYLKFVGLGMYGVWLTVFQALGWMALLDPGLSDIGRQRIAHAYGRGDSGAISRSLGALIALSAGVGLILLIVGAGLCAVLPQILQVPESGEGAVQAAGFLLAANAAVTLQVHALGCVLQATQRAKAHTIVIAIGNAAGLAATASFVVGGLGIEGISLGYLARSTIWICGLAGVVLVLITKKLLPRPALHWPAAREFVSLSRHAGLGKLSHLLQFNMDALAAGLICGAPAAAQLVLTGRLFELARTVPTLFSSAAAPGLTHIAAREGGGHVARSSRRYFTVVGQMTAVLCGAALVLTPDVTVLWMGPDAYGGPVLCAFLGLAAVSSALLTGPFNVLFAQGEIQSSSQAMFRFGALKLVLVLILMPFVGVVAAPVATTLAASTTAMPAMLRSCRLRLRLSRRRFRYHLRALFLAPAACLLAGAVLLLLWQSAASGWLMAAAKAAIVVLLLLTLTASLMPRWNRRLLGNYRSRFSVGL